jgi:hypothetical protein
MARINELMWGFFNVDFNGVTAKKGYESAGFHN